MDAPEEDLDVKLQKISNDLIVDFDNTLEPFLRKSDGVGGHAVRSRVRTRETQRLVSSVNGAPSDIVSIRGQLAKTLNSCLTHFKSSRSFSTRICLGGCRCLAMPF